MRALTIALLVIAIGFVSVAPMPSSAQVLLGGVITYIDRVPSCINGVLPIYVGIPIPGLYMYGLGTLSYSFGPPVHESQFLLGLATAVMPCLIIVSCGITVCVIPKSFGPLILFHGSSI